MNFVLEEAGVGYHMDFGSTIAKQLHELQIGEGITSRPQLQEEGGIALQHVCQEQHQSDIGVAEADLIIGIALNGASAIDRHSDALDAKALHTQSGLPASAPIDVWGGQPRYLAQSGTGANLIDQLLIHHESLSHDTTKHPISLGEGPSEECGRLHKLILVIRTGNFHPANSGDFRAVIVIFAHFNLALDHMVE